MANQILLDKVAVVTGAGSGIARSTAIAFAREGAAVTVVDINRAAAERTVSAITDQGGRAVLSVCDVASRSAVDATVAATVSAFGRLDILVNAAFANPAFGKPFIEQTERDVQVNLSTSFMGTWNFMQAAFPHLPRPGGKVINFVSAAFTEGQLGMAAYGAAKGAVAGLVNCVCQEWGPLGINVNNISPVVHTEAYDEFLKTAPPGAHEGYIALNPMRRLGDPDRDAARVAVFLAGPDSDYINGRIISVDGGRGLYRF